MKPNYKKYVRIYYAAYIFAYILFVVLSTFFAYIFDNSLGVNLTAGGVYLILLILLRRVIQIKLVALFNAHPNGEEFLKIVNIPRLGFSATDRMVVAQHAMDYQTVVNIATTLLQSKKANANIKDICLSVLVQTYFEIRDYEKMAAILREHDELHKVYPMIERDPVREYYGYFLDRDYKSCLDVCAKEKELITDDSDDSKYKKAAITYRAAVALYEMGNTEAARTELESILSELPEYANKSALAKKYIAAIDSGEPVVISETKVQPEPSVIAKNKRKRIIAKVCLTVAFAVSIVASIYLLGNTRDERTIQFEEKLDVALSKRYEDAEVIDYFWLEKDGEVLDNLCLIETDGKLALLSVTTPDNEITADTWILKEGIDPSVDTSQYTLCVSSKYYIKMNFSTEKPKAEPLYYSVKFKFSGTTYWFYIDYYENVLVFD